MLIEFNDPWSDKPFKTGKYKCPICGKTGRFNCRVREDETLATCSNVASDKMTSDGKAYIHELKNHSSDYGSFINKPSNPKIVSVPIADGNRLNNVYTALLKEVGINSNHLEKLIHERGLSEEVIEKNLYSSVPDYSKGLRVAQKLAESFDLEGIPGFYQQDEQWCLNLNVEGFYVPFRNELGHIVGLQIRKDKFTKNDKYLWVSSNGKLKGTSSGSPLHFVNPDLVRETRGIYITEGALKADVIGELYSVGVMALGGVNVLKADKFVSSLIKTFPEADRAIIAFDMDWETNKDVKKALVDLLKALKSTNLEVLVLNWDRSLGKGLDDLLLFARNSKKDVSHYLKRTSAEEFQEILDAIEMKASEMEEIKEGAVKEVKAEIMNKNIKENTADLDMGLQKEVNGKESINSFGMTWRDFDKTKLSKPEKVIRGLGRGNVGILNAMTNLGKTTLILNLAISIASDRSFPLISDETVGKRVMYIDGEATKSELQADIRKMLESCSEAQKELVRDRLFFLCDEEIDDESLDIVNKDHLEVIRKKALEFKPDLIIIDTLSALALMEDENDNSKVKAEVMKPLKTLAKGTNSAILILHHTGKYSEGSPQAADSYKGRGASAFGALSRSVYLLNRAKNSTVKVNLSCPKTKGDKIETVVMKLDQSTRWFKIFGKTTEMEEIKKDSNYEQVLSSVRTTYFATGQPVAPKTIIAELDGKVGSTTVTRKLIQALQNHDLFQPYYGVYAVPQDE